MTMRQLRATFALLVAAAACGSDRRLPSSDASPEAPSPEGFELRIFPILQAAGCGACHEPGLQVVRHWALTTPADTYAHWVNAPGFDHCGPNGEQIVAPIPDQIRVVPGDPDSSLVMKKLTDPWEMCGEFYGHMPPSPAPRLPADQIDLVRAWIAAGAVP
jgi:hypothetical protein